MHVHNRTRCPGIAFVNWISVGINLKRTIEVCPLLDRAFAVVLKHPAPEDSLTFVVGALEFEPGIVSVHCTAWEKVADLFRADHDVNSHRIAKADRRLNAV